MLQRPLTAALLLTLAFPLTLHAADGDLDTGFSSDGKDVQDWNVVFSHALATAAERSSTAKARCKRGA